MAGQRQSCYLVGNGFAVRGLIIGPMAEKICTVGVGMQAFRVASFEGFLLGVGVSHGQPLMP